MIIETICAAVAFLCLAGIIFCGCMESRSSTVRPLSNKLHDELCNRLGVRWLDERDV